MNAGELLKTVSATFMPYKLASMLPEMSELRRDLFPTPTEVIGDRASQIMVDYLNMKPTGGNEQ